MIAATLPTNKECLVMQLRTGRTPVFGAILLFALSLFATPMAAFGREEKREPSDAWVQPESLIAELELLQKSPYTASWAESTIQTLNRLDSLTGIGDPESSEVFDQLQDRLKRLDFLITELLGREVKSPATRDNLVSILRQTHYSMARRLAIWPIVHEIALTSRHRLTRLDEQQAGKFLLASRERLNVNQVEQGWAEYLKLDDAVTAFNSINAKETTRRKAARAVLARAYNPALSVSQKKYLTDAIDEATLGVLKASAVGDLDLHQFLARLEWMESRNNGASQYRVNDFYQSALWSDDPEFQRLAGELQQHYRNGNFRVSIHEVLLNRMIPPLPDTQEPYRDNILGAQVRGQTRISNTLNIGLIPDPNQISMHLETLGNVKSRTVATRSGVVIENEGDSRFRIIKRLALGQQGIFAYRPETTSQVRQRVVGLRTNMDNIPPLGWMVRKIARNKIQQQAPITNRYTKNQLEQEAEKRFEEEVQTRLGELETLLTERLLHPLVALDLEPDPVQISTTDDQIIMRYRLGGRDQMAANTARPREKPGSLMSMQIHESAVNNVISRFGFNGRKFDTDELIAHVNNMFQTEFVKHQGKTRPASFEFAPFDPVRIDFRRRQDQHLHQFEVVPDRQRKKMETAQHQDNLRCSDRKRVTVKLIQTQDGLQLTGRQLNPADQIAIRVICEVLFPNEFSVKMMPENLGSQLSVNSLQATQFVLSNGWIGISVADAQPVAGQNPEASARQSRRFLNRWRQQ